MLVLYLTVIVLVLSALKYNQKFNTDYISIETTNTIKGVFILLIFISHILPYLQKGTNPQTADSFFISHNYIGQWVVAMFLFYSGFGVMEAIKKNGYTYVSSIPRHRILNTIINFDLAVLVFIITAFAFNKPLSIKQCILSLTAWDSVGNSNWYIFVILVCYIATFVSFYKSNNHTKSAIYCLIIMLCTLITLSYYKQPWWYNTMLCYNAGMFFSIYKTGLVKRIKNSYWLFITISIAALLVFGNIDYEKKGLIYNLFSIAFCIIIVLVSMRFNIRNRILEWCGLNLFSLYIYQRVPMIVFSSIDNGAFIYNFPNAYIFICLLATIIIGYFYKYWKISF